MADPKCPSCGISGTTHIVSSPSEEKSRKGAPWFYISHCAECGHVYGVFTKHVFGPAGPQLIVERS